MKNLSTYLILLIVVAGCVGTQNNEVHYLQKNDEVSHDEFEVVPVSSKVRFEFETEKIDPSEFFFASIKINASLINDSEDTVFFLTTTCYGEQYSLQYDTSYFDIINLVFCNVNNPETQSIAPKKKHTFSTYLKNKKDTSVIKLGFDFYQVKRNLDMKEIFTTNIHHRLDENKSIIWYEYKLN